MTSKRREMLDLLHKVKNKAPRRLLNDTVRLIKTQEANNINRAGPKRQLDFLLDHMSQPEVVALVDRLLDNHRRMQQTADALRRRRKISDLTRSLYHYKACEADKLAMSDLVAQVRYVVGVIGGKRRLEAILENKDMT